MKYEHNMYDKLYYSVLREIEEKPEAVQKQVKSALMKVFEDILKELKNVPKAEAPKEEPKN